MLTCMLAKLRSCLVPATLVCIGVGATIGIAPAVTVEVAKKCAALTAKAFPPRVVGNPAAGFVGIAPLNVEIGEAALLALSR